MLIGVDFDNTIVCFDQVFHQVALEKDLITSDVSQNKGEVRDHMRQNGLEQDWIALQGYVYGVRIDDAQPFSGVLEFFEQCRSSGIRTCIISHKTRLPFKGPKYDLHAAAKRWLENNGLMAAGKNQVFLELTKQDKLDRIGAAGCTHFIDDLQEFLTEPGFPSGVQRILFDPSERMEAGPELLRAGSWPEIGNLIAL